MTVVEAKALRITEELRARGGTVIGILRVSENDRRMEQALIPSRFVMWDLAFAWRGRGHIIPKLAAN